MAVCRWLEDHDYAFKPNKSQKQKPFYEDVVLERLAEQNAPPLQWTEIEETVNRLNPIQSYSFRGLSSVLTFVKTRLDGAELKVQIVMAKETPMEVVLNFHSSMSSLALSPTYYNLKPI